MRWREKISVLGVLCVFVLTFGALAGCGGSDDEGEQGAEPAQEPTEETAAPTTTGENAVVVRVSGTPNTAYSGTYGTAREIRTVSTTTLEAEPTDYELEVAGEDGVLNATFRKTEPGRETLKVEVLVDGEVVTQSETSAELGSVIVNWVPEGALPEDTTLPKEFEKDNSQ